MKQIKAGFLLVEIMVTIALVTLVIGMLMRYQVQSLSWQADTVEMMQSVEEAQKILHNCSTTCNTDTRLQTYPLTRPVVQPHLDCLSLDCTRKMQFVIYKKEWVGSRGPQQCFMPTLLTEQPGDQWH